MRGESTVGHPGAWRGDPAPDADEDDAGARATAAADIAATLARSAPHAALAAAREAARAALLALAHRPHPRADADLRFLTTLASAPPDHLAGRPDEREAAVRRTLSILARLLPPASAALLEAERPAVATPRGPARRAEGRRRVLVVEDEWFIAVEIADSLLAAGFEVLGPVATVPDALRLVEAAEGDGGLAAAVLDINLDGVPVTPVADALTAIRVPILYATGYSSDSVQARRPGVPVLEKPFGSDALLRGMRALGTA